MGGRDNAWSGADANDTDESGHVDVSFVCILFSWAAPRRARSRSPFVLQAGGAVSEIGEI